jgi:hypothetical protein
MDSSDILEPTIFDNNKRLILLSMIQLCGVCKSDPIPVKKSTAIENGNF